MDSELPRTVLLVEDDPNDRMIVEHAFERTSPGVRVCMAPDGEEAVSYLLGVGAYANRGTYPLPEVILLDLKLPKKSGLEVLEWIREQPDLRLIPVLILSSSQERGDIDLAYALGANSYLVKQVDIQAVRRLVKGIATYSAVVPKRASTTG
jgi:CheY-like chemotaxis protein